MALGPVVARTALAKDEVVRAEEAAERARADGIHRAGLEIDEHRARHVLVRADLVVVDVDPLELQIVGALVLAVRLNTVLI